eukprot:2337922-Prymnesium_polylepis.1
MMTCRAFGAASAWKAQLASTPPAPLAEWRIASEQSDEASAAPSQHPQQLEDACATDTRAGRPEGLVRCACCAAWVRRLGVAERTAGRKGAEDNRERPAGGRREPVVVGARRLVVERAREAMHTAENPQIKLWLPSRHAPPRAENADEAGAMRAADAHEGRVERPQSLLTPL